MHNVQELLLELGRELVPSFGVKVAAEQYILRMVL